jgi:hypothetical protein
MIMSEAIGRVAESVARERLSAAARIDAGFADTVTKVVGRMAAADASAVA